MTNIDIANRLLNEARTRPEHPRKALTRAALLIRNHPIECTALGGAPELAGIGKGVQKRVRTYLSECHATITGSHAVSICYALNGDTLTSEERSAARDLLRTYVQVKGAFPLAQTVI